jgi:hypothetical protein
MQLAAMGYQFAVNGSKIHYDWQGRGDPDPDKAVQLLRVIKADREAAILFLRVYCSKCGGCFFWSDSSENKQCINCDPPDLMSGGRAQKHKN